MMWDIHPLLTVMKWHQLDQAKSTKENLHDIGGDTFQVKMMVHSAFSWLTFAEAAISVNTPAIEGRQGVGA